MEHLLRSLLVLASQAGGDGGGKRGASVEAVTLVIVMIALTLVGGVGILLYRKRVLSRQSDSDQSESLMQNLRRMRDSGQMTQEEYDKTRKAMATRLAGKLRPAIAREGAKDGTRAAPKRAGASDISENLKPPPDSLS